MSNSYNFTDEAYCKLLLHVVKYPHRTVNGILVGEHENSRVNITDVFPLFHNVVGVTPMLEIALAQIEVYCRLKSKAIVGYYQANELFNQNSLTLFSAGVGQKILENCAEACVVIVSNNKIVPVPSESATSPFTLYLPCESRGWKEASSGKLTVDEGSIEKYHRALDDNLDAELVDFDNYLDCPTADWLNRHLFPSSTSGDGSGNSSPQRKKSP